MKNPALNLTFMPFDRLLPSWQELIFAWRNRPEVRSQLLNSAPLDFADYKAFLQSFRYRSDELGFLVLKNAVPCGVVRAGLRPDLDDGSFELGLMYADTSENLPALASGKLFEVLPSLGFKRYQAYFRRDNLQSFYYHVLRMGHPIVREDELYYYVGEELTPSLYARLKERLPALTQCRAQFFV